MLKTRYDGMTQALHWSVAFLVVMNYIIGFGREFLPKGDVKTWMLMQHFSFGLIMLALVTLRIFWRLTASPVESVPMTTKAHFASRFAHMGLYILMIAVPVLGLIAAWVKGRTVGFFGITLENPFMINAAAGKFLEGVHGLASHGIMILAGIHAAVALLHHYWLKDGIMRRMLPVKAV